MNAQNTTTTHEKQADLARKLGAPVTLVNNHNGTFFAWVHTSLPAAKRAKLTPRLAEIAGGRAIGANILINA